MFPLFGGKQKRTIANLMLSRGAGLQTVPATESSGEACATILQRDWFLAARRNAAVNKWFRGAVDLRYRDLHAGLNWIQSGLRVSPRFDRLCV